MEIPLAEWSAWAPGIDSNELWDIYFDEAHSIDFSLKPDITFLPAMFRRRLSPLCRMIFHTVNKLENKDSLSAAPVLFGSRHGELDLSIDLISSELTDIPISPAKFSMSVHNSPAGLLSIYYRNKAPANAVSAGRQTLQMALIEAMGLLQTHNSCLLIYADIPQAEIYSEYNDEETFPVCLTLLLTQASPKMDIALTPNDTFTAKSVIKQLCNYNRNALA